MERVVWSGVVCCALGVLVYLNTLSCGIVYDDEPAIKKNKDLHPTSPWSGLLTHDFWGSAMSSTTSHKSYRPLCVATFRLNYLFHQLEPMGYHLVNAVLHGVVCLLYTCVCVCVSNSSWLGLAAGALFAVHPIHAEAVAGLVGRTELLSAIFFILAFLAYRKSTLTLAPPQWWWLVLSVFFTLCSALSKEQGITVAAVCLTYDFFIVHKMNLTSSVQLLGNLVSRRQGVPPWFSSFVKRASTWCMFVLAFLTLRVYLMKEGPNIFNKSINPPMNMDTPYRQLNWLYLVFINTWQLVNPVFLCPDWRFGTVPLITTPTDPRNLLTFVTLAAMSALILYSLCHDTPRAKMVGFGMSLVVFPFLPASNLFFPVGFVVAERVLYLPSMGYCLLVTYGLSRLIRSTERAWLRVGMATPFLLLIGLFAMRTVMRNEDWVSNLTLYSSGVRCNSHNGVMLTNLGIEHGRIRNFTFAETLYRRSMQVAPQHSRGYVNLGGLLEALKRYDEAEEVFRKGLVLGEMDSTGSKVIEGYVFLINSIILRKGQRRYHDALELWDQAITTYPTYAKLHGHKGVVLYQMGRVEEAVQYLETAVRSNVGDIPDVFYYLGMSYVERGGGGRGKEAARELFKRTLLLEPNHTGARTQLEKL